MTIVALEPRPLRETLVCLHASAASAREWDALVALLPPRLHALTPDLLGYAGPLRWPVGTAVSLDEEADAVAPLLPAHGAHLFGHSYGGAVALQLALRRPERIRSLTLYEPARFALLAGDPALADLRRLAGRIGERVHAGRLHEAAEAFVDEGSGGGRWAALGARARQAVVRRMPKVDAEFGALFADRVPASAYTKLEMPVRLVGGSCSPPRAGQVLDRLARLLPAATRVTLAGLGHGGPIEDPARFAGLLATAAVPLAA